MKNTFTLLVVCILASFSGLQAQETHYGVRFGLNISSINGQSFDLVTKEGGTATEIPNSVESSRIGAGAYFFAEIPINDKISFQPELGFASLGVKYQPLRIDYLHLPLGIKFNVSENFYVNLGPQIGAKIWFHEQSSNYKYIDILGFGGIGFKISENMFIDARYTLGFTEVYSSTASAGILTSSSNDDGTTTFKIDNSLDNLSGKNAYFQLTIGYRL